jgi:DNA primase
VKTSGSKVFHIVVPLDGKSGFDEVAGFAHCTRLSNQSRLLSAYLYWSIQIRRRIVARALGRS